MTKAPETSVFRGLLVSMIEKMKKILTCVTVS